MKHRDNNKETNQSSITHLSDEQSNTVTLIAQLLYHGLVLKIVNIFNAVLLTCVFFVIIFPLSIILKLLGKDPLRRTLNKEIPSYYVDSHARSRDHMNKPY